MLPADLVTRPDLDVLPSDTCFIYIPFENEGRLALPQGVLSDIPHEALEPKDFHLTLLMASQCSLEQMTTFIANLSPTMRFFIEVPSLGTLQGLDSPVLTWQVDPGPQLMRLQQDLYNAAFNEGMDISRFSDPRTFTPHISVAYGLARDLEEEDIPTIEPFRLEVNDFIIGRSDEDHVFRVSLPHGVMVETLIIERDEKQDIPRDIGWDIAPDAISVTKSELGALIRGETITHGPMRYLMDLSDGPFTLKHGTHQGQEGVPGSQGGSSPGFTHGGAGSSGDKPSRPGRKQTDTPSRTPSAKRFFGKAHHTPIELDLVPDSEDFDELFNTMESWQGRAASMVDGLLEDAFDTEPDFEGDDAARMDMFDKLIDEGIDEQLSLWYDIKNLDPETFPIPAERLTEMSDQEIDDELRFIADLEHVDRPTDDDITNALIDAGATGDVGAAVDFDYDGNMRSYFFGRDGGEIVVTTMTTEKPAGSYDVDSLMDDAEYWAESAPAGTEGNYDPVHFEDTEYVHVDWLAAKRSREGFGSSMMAQIFQGAAANSAGVYLTSTFEGQPFYESLGGNEVSEGRYFWTPTQVEELAKLADEESVSVRKSWVTRENVNEVVFGADKPGTMFGQAGDEDEGADLEPLDGVFTMGPTIQGEVIRPWKRHLREKIEEFEVQQGMNQISPEDQAILDARKPKNIVKPDSREQMLMGVQRSLEDMATTIIGTVYQIRHGEHVDQAGEEGRRGGSQTGFTHVPGSVGGTSVDEGPGQGEAGDADRVASMQRVAKALKRIMRGQQNIEVNPTDKSVYAEIRAGVDDWQPKAQGMVDGFLMAAERASNEPILHTPQAATSNFSSDSEGFQRGEGGTPRELGWEVDMDNMFELMGEVVQDQIETDVSNWSSDLQTAMTDFYVENSTWQEVAEFLDLTEEQMLQESDDTLHAMVAEIVVLNELENEGVINTGEYASLYDVETNLGGPYGERDGEPEQIGTWIYADQQQEFAEESITEFDVEQYHGFLPYINPDTGDTMDVASDEYIELYPPDEFEDAYDEPEPEPEPEEAPHATEAGLITYRPHRYMLVGRGEGGEVQAVLSAEIEVGGSEFSNYRIDRMIEDGTHKNLELSEQDLRDLNDDAFMHFGYLAGRQGGAGHGAELLLRGLKIAADNNAGIYGSSVGDPTTVSLYDKLGARWAAEDGDKHGGTAIFTPDDVQFAVKWLTDAGISLDGSETGDQIEIIEGSWLTLRFNIWVLGEIDESELPTEHFTVMDRDYWTDQQSEWNSEFVAGMASLRATADGEKNQADFEDGMDKLLPERAEHEVAESDEVAEDGNQEDKATEEFVDYSEVADRWLRENFGPVMMTLNPKEKNALKQFRGDMGDFQKFNEGEETMGEEPEMDSMMTMVDDIMARSEVPSGVMVYRGMEISGQMVTHFDSLEGEVFQASGFTPTSLKPDKALEFVEQSKEEAAVLEIGVPAGTNAIWMDFDARPLEDFELLLPEDLKFRIVETGTADEGKFIVAEIV